MAERFQLGPRQPGAPNQLLDVLLAPGSRSFGRGTQGNPYLDLMQIVQRGNQGLGVGPMEGYFQDGVLSDPGGLLRLLNVSGLARTGAAQGRSGPWDQPGPGLGGWLRDLDQGRYGTNRPFDPRSLAFTGPQIAPDMTLTAGQTTLDQLNEWANRTQGTDFATFAAMSPNLRQTRQDWQADPSQWFNPEAPGVLATTRIPGLNPADSALRSQQYGQGWQNLQAERRGSAQQGAAAVAGGALQRNPFAGRTSYGALMGIQGPAQAQLGAPGVQTQPPDYSAALQRALFPYTMNQYLRSVL